MGNEGNSNIPEVEQEVVDTLTNDEHISLDLICAATGRKLTLEQKIFASDFTKPTISFSDAGTGCLRFYQ